MIGYALWVSLWAYLFGAVFMFGWLVGLHDAQSDRSETQKQILQFVGSAALIGAVWPLVTVGARLVEARRGRKA